ncbi:MAG: PEP-CTERM sorting domain-containing protein [Planctomycetota bacterium]
MFSNKISTIAVLAVAGTAFAGTTDLVASFGFTDLNGSFIGSANSGTFTATAAGAGAASTSGDVTRLAGGVSETAQFNADFADDADEADVVINISVAEIAGELVGTGSFEITDTDGDSLTGDISGEWFVGPFGFVFFNGMIDNANFASDGDSGEGLTFDGPNGGSFAFADILADLNGAFSLLFNDEDAFSTSFEDASVQGDGLLVPAPGALAIAGAGLLVAGRRRR